MSFYQDKCVEAIAVCTAAAERCAACCGTSGNLKREQCALLGRDCADVGRLAQALLLRDSPYAAEACALHAETCDAYADYCEKWPKKACCRSALLAARACASACRVVCTAEAA